MHWYGLTLAILHYSAWPDLAISWSYPIRDMSVLCNGLLYLDKPSVFQIELTAEFNYKPNMNCTLYIYAESSMRMMRKFKSINIEDSVLCSNDRLTLYDGPSTDSPKLTGNNGICGFVSPPNIFTTTTATMTIKFISDSTLQYKGFTLILTAFSDVCKSGTDFQCRNNRCIDRALTCDGWNNCGDNTDETEGCGLSVGGIAGIVVAGLVICLIFMTVAVVFKRRRGKNEYANIM